MAERRIGKWTVRLARPPVILATAAVAGRMEGEGPLGHEFDQVYPDLMLGQKSFEAAEQQMMKDACQYALQKARIGGTPPKIEYFLAGDLLNQIITSTFSALDIQVPFLGLYGACSTFCESLSLGAMLIDGGYADHVLCATGSHNASAERQYRYPVEYGGQRKPYAQTTVTGSGAVVLGREGDGPRITHITHGRVVDMGITDPFNQGAAMAPAAVETLQHHFKDTGLSPGDYDLIVTGDLATFGHQIAVELAAQKGLQLGPNYKDCGMLIFDREKQHVDSGGSGCGCSAIVSCGHLIPEMRRGNIKRLLIVATGALLSPTSFQQGENIPAIAHAVAIEV